MNDKDLMVFASRMRTMESKANAAVLIAFGSLGVSVIALVVASLALLR